MKTVVKLAKLAEALQLQNLTPEIDMEKIEEAAVKMATDPTSVDSDTMDMMERAKNLTEDDIKAQALADESVRKFTDGKELKKVIYIKGKLLNIVAV